MTFDFSASISSSVCEKVSILSVMVFRYLSITNSRSVGVSCDIGCGFPYAVFLSTRTTFGWLTIPWSVLMFAIRIMVRPYSVRKRYCIMFRVEKNDIGQFRERS